MAEQTLGITVKKDDDFSEWYNQVILKAELADFAPIRGFMVIRPRAYQLWEKIQGYFNKVMDSYGVANAYFPLLIPGSFFKREAEHAEGFAPELAWVEKKDGEEKVAIRPTSETIIYDAYSKWINSWRDLPLRMNQWCNVLRWEVKQTKMFLRTREFLWQEGHCVYADKADCDKEVRLFLDEYKKMCEELLAIPVIAGIKTDAEKFAGALYTTTIEALMPDGKALQMGTSHNLGQGFAKSFGINFLDSDSNNVLPWQSSWGFSTRLIGAIIMVHGDNKGLVLPPRIAKNKAVIVPIIFDDSKDAILKKARELREDLEEFGVFVDDRENYSAGWKFSDWELKGIPVRVELGPKDLEKGHVVLVRRDNGKKEFVKFGDLNKRLVEVLEEMQKEMFSNAKKFLDDNTVTAKTREEFKKFIDERKMVYAYFCGDSKAEEEIKDWSGASSRCIPFDEPEQDAKCIFTGKPAKKRVLFAKSY